MTDLPSGDIRATINYLRDPPTDDPAVPIKYDAIGQTETTMRLRPIEVTVTDGRPNSANYSLDAEGFMLVPHRTSITDFLDRSQTHEVYPREAGALIRELTGAYDTLATGTNVRFAREQRADYRMSSDHKPAGFAHADFTPLSAQGFLGLSNKDPSEYSRWAIYNVWQVWSEPPQDFPLALCDARTVTPQEEDVVQIKVDVPGQDVIHNLSTVYQPSPANHWHYFSNMKIDELIVFKGFDSDPQRTQRVPHTAIRNAAIGPEYPTRKSIETRVLAFYR